MKKFLIIAVTVIALALSSCSAESNSIPFEENSLYAVAYLGYGDKSNLDLYLEQYLDTDSVPEVCFSQGEYYLIIPRYTDMKMTIYKNDTDTDNYYKFYTSDDSRPFLIQCNVSDIISDVKIEYEYKGETTSFIPSISLKDGSVKVGERGTDITGRVDTVG